MPGNALQIICALIIAFFSAHCSCQIIVAIKEQLLKDLFTDYNKIISPILDGGDALEVQMEMYPRSIKDFDEVSESFVYIAGLRMVWKDFRLAWDSDKYAGIDTITVPVTQVWTPEIFLASPATKEMYILQPWNQVRIDYDGQVVIVQAMLVESSCSMNVKYYPFDTQSCDTLFMSLVYTVDEVNVVKTDNGVHFGLYTENPLWDIVSTSVYSEIFPLSTEVQIHFTFNLKRKSQYVTINLLVPILCLSLLNTLVFLLVPESGERVGYCITNLLAIAVYMTIIMDTLPQSSTPVPLIAYKLVVDLLSSALIILCVILNLRVHGQSDDKKIPVCVKALYRFLTCKICKRNTVTDIPKTPFKTKDTKVFTEQEGDKSSVKRGNVGSAKEHELPTWRDISFMIDIISFLFFVLVSILSFIIFVTVAKRGD